MKTILFVSTIISIDISLVDEQTKTIIFIKENTKRMLIIQHSFYFKGFLEIRNSRTFLKTTVYAFCSLRAIHGRTSPSPRSANGIMIFEIKTNHHSDGFCA